MVKCDKKGTICFKISKDKKCDLKLHNSNLIISKPELFRCSFGHITSAMFCTNNTVWYPGKGFTIRFDA